MAINDVKLNIKYGEKGGLPTAKTNGTLYVAKKGIDNKAELYVDLDGTRYLISDALTADNTLNSTSENAVQNKVINSAFNEAYTVIAEKAPKENGVHYVIGTGTTAGTWLGQLEDSSADLYNGLMIAYKIPVKGADTTTLNINGKGAKTVKLNASTALTTQYPVGSIIFLVYDTATNTWKISNYDSNTGNTVGDYVKNGAKLYFVGTESADTTTTSSYATSYVNNNIYVDTKNKLNSASGFIGNLEGNASTATNADFAAEASSAATAETANKLNSNAGGLKKPIYFANGVPTECGNTLSVNIEGNAASADKLNSNAGDTDTPIYFENGVPKACGNILDVDIKGNASTANNAAIADSLGIENVGASDKAIYLLGGIPKECVGPLAYDITGNAETADKAKALNVSTAIGDASNPVYIDATGVPQIANQIVSDVENLQSDLNSLEGAFNQDVVDLNNHIKDTIIHVTQDDKDLWNNYENSKAKSEHIHKVTHTPSGTVTSTFTGQAATSGKPSATATVASSTHTHGYTPAGTVSAPTFTGTQGTASASYTPAGSVSQPTFTGAETTLSATYTPAGTVTKPTFTGSEVTTSSISGTTNIYSITGVGSLPSSTFVAPTLTASVANRCLTLTFNAGSHTFDAGSLPTRSSAISVATGTHTHKVTPSGTVSQPIFGGTEATIEIDYTPTGTISQPTFTGTKATINSTYTPKGSVSAPTFTGTAGTTTSISGTTTVAGNEHTHSVTAKGTVGSTFSGTAATLTTTTEE